MQSKKLIKLARRYMMARRAFYVACASAGQDDITETVREIEAIMQRGVFIMDQLAVMLEKTKHDPAYNAALAAAYKTLLRNRQDYERMIEVLYGEI